MNISPMNTKGHYRLTTIVTNNLAESGRHVIQNSIRDLHHMNSYNEIFYRAGSQINLQNYKGMQT